MEVDVTAGEQGSLGLLHGPHDRRRVRSPSGSALMATLITLDYTPPARQGAKFQPESISLDKGPVSGLRSGWLFRFDGTRSTASLGSATTDVEEWRGRVLPLLRRAGSSISLA